MKYLQLNYLTINTSSLKCCISALKTTHWADKHHQNYCFPQHTASYADTEELMSCQVQLPEVATSLSYVHSQPGSCVRVLRNHPMCLDTLLPCSLILLFFGFWYNFFSTSGLHQVCPLSPRLLHTISGKTISSRLLWFLKQTDYVLTLSQMKRLN